MSSLNISIKRKTQQKVCKMADVITETDVITEKNDDQEWYHLFKNSQPNMLFVLYRINNTSDAYMEKYWFLNPPGVDTKIFAREKNKAMKKTQILKN